jgi:hypothetical protein
VLQPEYELRIWLDSLESDTLAFVCLRGSDWSLLEHQVGDRLHARFGDLEGCRLWS